MELLKSILLGLIQGLTEFLPVSSSGHLVIFKHLFGFEMNDISFEIFLHLGSLLAVLIYFRKDLLELIGSLLHISKPNTKDKANLMYILYLLMATFVTTLIALTFKDTIESLFAKPIFSAFMLIGTGIIVFSSDFIKSGSINAQKMGIWKAVIIGLGQSFAMLPGISRSGSTIATALFVGVRREQVARFSFILSIPAILGAAVLKLDEFTALLQYKFMQSFDQYKDEPVFLIYGSDSFLKQQTLVAIQDSIVDKNARDFDYEIFFFKIVLLIKMLVILIMKFSLLMKQVQIKLSTIWSNIHFLLNFEQLFIKEYILFLQVIWIF